MVSVPTAVRITVKDSEEYIVTNDEFQVALKAQEDRLRAELKREVPWFKARFAAISADPLTACFVAAVVYLVDHAAVPVLKWFGVL